MAMGANLNHIQDTYIIKLKNIKKILLNNLK